jgi:hypothetical protein
MLKTMTPTVNKILPVALVAALLGGTAGALISRRTAEPANQTTATSPVATLGATDQITPSTANTAVPAANGQDTYRNGFNDGLKAANEQTSLASNGVASDTTSSSSKTNTSSRRVAYRAPSRSTRYSSSRRAYYDYNQPKSRSFWDKHRDKLTVAMGTGGGALLGGLFGGKKGAAIGALAGGGGSALYTYKVRKKNRRY